MVRPPPDLPLQYETETGNDGKFKGGKTFALLVWDLQLKAQLAVKFLIPKSS